MSIAINSVRRLVGTTFHVRGEVDGVQIDFTHDFFSAAPTVQQAVDAIVAYLPSHPLVGGGGLSAGIAVGIADGEINVSFDNDTIQLDELGRLSAWQSRELALRFDYAFARDGGAVGLFPLSAGVGARPVPAGCLLVGATFDITDALAGGDTTRISMALETEADLIGEGNLVGSGLDEVLTSVLIPNSTNTHGIGAVTLADCTLLRTSVSQWPTLKVINEDLSGGAFALWLRLLRP